MTKEELFESVMEASSDQAVRLGIIAHVINTRITERGFEALEEMIKALKKIRETENWV